MAGSSLGRGVVLLSTLLALPLAAAEERFGDVIVSGSWTRATPNAATTAAAYVTLAVAGAQGDRLIDVFSPRAERVELHRGTETAGVMRMAAVPEIVVGPGAPTVLQPGGLHLMLIGLKAPLATGDTLPLTFTFARSGRIAIDVPILDLAARGPEDAPPPDPHAGH